MSKKSLHNTKLKAIDDELSDEEHGEKAFRTSVLLLERQKLALDEERLRIRRQERRSVSVTELIREAIDDWLRKRRSQ